MVPAKWPNLFSSQIWSILLCSSQKWHILYLFKSETVYLMFKCEITYLIFKSISYLTFFKSEIVYLTFVYVRNDLNMGELFLKG
jgi:hypothetical protein